MELILEELHSSEGDVTIADLAEALCIEPEVALDLVRRLERRGEVECEGDGLYTTVSPAM